MNLVSSRSALLKNVKEYQLAVLSKSGRIKPSIVRRWYYFPELNMIAASRFIGYEGMTAEIYDGILSYKIRDTIDGGQTQDHLQKTGWFEPLDKDSPEYSAAYRLADKLIKSTSMKSVSPWANFYIYRPHDPK
jgi:hypothetical protein